MREMKYIMKPVIILIEDIVRKRVANKYAIPLQITLPIFALCNFDFKTMRKTLLVWKIFVKWRPCGFGACK